MSPRDQLPGGADPDDPPWWPADGPWGGRGRTSVLLVLGGLVVVVALVLVATLVGGLFQLGRRVGLGRRRGPASPVLASEGLQPASRTLLGGVPYDVGVGPFTPSTRAAPSGSHLLLAPVVVRNAGSGPVVNPLSGAAGVLVAVGLHAVPEWALSGPSALLCRNRPASSALAAAGTRFPGLESGACVLDGRTAPSGAAASTLAPGKEARGILLSSPVPDVVTDPAPSVWVQTTAGPPARYERVSADGPEALSRTCGRTGSRGPGSRGRSPGRVSRQRITPDVIRHGLGAAPLVRDLLRVVGAWVAPPWCGRGGVPLGVRSRRGGVRVGR